MPGPSRTQQGRRASAGWEQSPLEGWTVQADTQHLCQTLRQMAERVQSLASGIKLVAASSIMRMGTCTALCLTALVCSKGSSQTASVPPFIRARTVPTGRSMMGACHPCKSLGPPLPFMWPSCPMICPACGCPTGCATSNGAMLPFAVMWETGTLRAGREILRTA